MNPRKQAAWWRLALIAFCILPGCGKTNAPADARAFDKADPEFKSIWDQALAADQTNDYFIAATGYNQLVAQESKLTPAQFNSVLAASRQLMQRAEAAADGGDPAAKQALAKLMAAQNQH